MSSQQEFAAKVLAAFEEAGHYTDKEVGEAGGPSTTFMTALRKAAAGELVIPEPRSDTFRKIDRAAEWNAGGARGLWTTGRIPDRKTADRRLGEALGMPPKSPAQKRADYMRRAPGIESYIQEIADRLLEVEERVDLVEEEIRQARSPGTRLRAARDADDPKRLPPMTDE